MDFLSKLYDSWCELPPSLRAITTHTIAVIAGAYFFG